MIIIKQNIWNVDADYRIITTNGDIKKDGSAVMGKGLALQAAQKYPDLPLRLGIQLKNDNKCYIFPDMHIITFPTKYHWRENSNYKLIMEGIDFLKRFSYNSGLTFVMPIPGTGNGNLHKGIVLSLLEILPDNVLVCNYDI